MREIVHKTICLWITFGVSSNNYKCNSNTIALYISLLSNKIVADLTASIHWGPWESADSCCWSSTTVYSPCPALYFPIKPFISTFFVQVFVTVTWSIAWWSAGEFLPQKFFSNPYKKANNQTSTQKFLTLLKANDDPATLSYYHVELFCCCLYHHHISKSIRKAFTHPVISTSVEFFFNDPLILCHVFI